jgi:hypothetical protein
VAAFFFGALLFAGDDAEPFELVDLFRWIVEGLVGDMTAGGLLVNE